MLHQGREMSSGTFVGFVIPAVIQALLGMVILGPVATNNPLDLLGAAYAVLAMVGIVFLFVYKRFGNWIENKQNFVYIIFGFITPVAGFIFVSWVTMKFVLYFLSFKWVGQLVRFMKSTS